MLTEQPSPTIGNARFLAVAAATVLLALGLSWHFFVQPLRPWPDQGWVLEAAVRHSRGEGLTTRINSTSGDLTGTQFARLVYFPPLYPLAVSGLIQAGLPVETAVKGVNVAAMLAGVVGWLLLARRGLLRWTTFALFAALLVVAGSATVPKGGTADYVFWAATPFWLLGLLAGRNTDNDGRRWLLLLASGLLVATLIGVRWVAVVLVPAGCVLLLWPENGRRVFARGMAAAVYAIPPVAAYFLIGAVNRAYSEGGANAASFFKPTWQWHQLLTLYPFESLLTRPLALEPLLVRMLRAAGSSGHAVFPNVGLRVVVPLAAVLALAWTQRGKAPPLSPGNRELLRGLAIMAVLTVLFLAFMAVRYNWDFVNWSFLEEPRYYRPLWPAAALFWLILLECVQPRWLRLVVVGSIAVGVVYLLQAQVRFEYDALTTPDESWELVEKVRSLQGREGIQIVLDSDVSDYVVTAKPNLVVVQYYAPEKVPDLKVSRPADLWLVRRVNEKTAYMLDGDFDANRFNAMCERFHPEPVWHSTGGNYELYHASVAP